MVTLYFLYTKIFLVIKSVQTAFLHIYSLFPHYIHLITSTKTTESSFHLCAFWSFISSLHGILLHMIACPCEITNKRKLYLEIFSLLSQRNDFYFVKICFNSLPSQSVSSHPIPCKSVPTQERSVLWLWHTSCHQTLFRFLLGDLVLNFYLGLWSGHTLLLI